MPTKREQTAPDSSRPDPLGFANFDFTDLIGEEIVVQFGLNMIMFLRHNNQYDMLPGPPSQDRPQGGPVAVPFLAGKLESFDSASGVLCMSHMTPDIRMQSQDGTLRSIPSQRQKVWLQAAIVSFITKASAIEVAPAAVVPELIKMAPPGPVG